MLPPPLFAAAMPKKTPSKKKATPSKAPEKENSDAEALQSICEESIKRARDMFGPAALQKSS